MEEIITLHCGIDNCNTHYEYKHNEGNIIAISAQWRNEESQDGDWAGLLPQQPKAGNIYELFISFPLKIDLAQSFWATYFEPYTEHEGIESEVGINSMAFCLCHKKSVKNLEKRFARIEVEVLDVKKITEENNVTSISNKSLEFIDKEINSQYVSVENFANFSLVIANYQSDCGWTYIIEKENGKSRIVAEHHWDFHTKIWQLTNEELNREQEKKYGIQHSI